MRFIAVDLDTSNHSQTSLRVFLCHSSEDKPAVRDLYRRLKIDGFSPWLDEEDLLPGHDWREEISKAVRAADVVIVCLSKSSVTKEGYVQKEIRFALDVEEEKPPGTIFIIPVRLEMVQVPERLKKWQWADLFRDGGYERLIRSLQIRSGKVRISGQAPKSLVDRSRTAKEAVSDQPAKAKLNIELEMFQAERIRDQFIDVPEIYKLFQDSIKSGYWQDAHSASKSPDEAKIRLSVQVNVEQAAMLRTRYKQLGGPTDKRIYEIINDSIKSHEAG